MSPSLIPLLVLALLFMAVDHRGTDSAQLILDGTHEVASSKQALIVGDASVTVPTGAELAGPIYLIGGRLRLQGTVDTSVVQLGGLLEVEGSSRIIGELRTLGGTRVVSEDAAVGRRTAVQVPRSTPNPVLALIPYAGISITLAVAGGMWARRRPRTLANVDRALTRHPVVSVTIGMLVTVISLSLLIFMAFTLILIPVSILGLLTGALALGYGLIAMGYLVGRRIPLEGEGVATGVGILVVMATLELLGLIPVVGDLVAMGILVAALGAVIITYFGLREFEPVKLPD